MNFRHPLSLIPKEILLIKNVFDSGVRHIRFDLVVFDMTSKVLKGLEKGICFLLGD
jgi:hypothetical protein